MTVAEILSAIRASRRFPSAEECELVAREDSYEQVAEVMVFTACTNQALRRRYRELHREKFR